MAIFYSTRFEYSKGGVNNYPAMVDFKAPNVLIAAGNAYKLYCQFMAGKMPAKFVDIELQGESDKGDGESAWISVARIKSSDAYHAILSEEKSSPVFFMHVDKQNGASNIWVDNIALMDAEINNLNMELLNKVEK